MNYPPTKKFNFTETLHGEEISDSFHWLEDTNDDVKVWVESQNQYTHSILDKLPSTKHIKDRLLELYRVEFMRIPVPRKGRYFFRYRKPGEDHSVLYVQEGLGGEKRLLVDPNTLSEDKTVTLSNWQPSRDGSLLLYGVSDAANDREEIRVMNVTTGKVLEDKIPSDTYPHICSWSVDNGGFWYVRRKPNAPKGEEKFHRRIYWHTLGTKYTEDTLFFGDQINKEDSPSCKPSLDGKYILVTVWIRSGKEHSSELYLYSTEEPEKGFLPIVKNIPAQFMGGFHMEYVYIGTNHKAARGKVMRVKITEIEKGLDNWKEIIPETEKNLENSKIIQDKIFVEFLENAYSILCVYSLEGKFIKKIELPLGSIGELVGESEGEELFFALSSFNLPMTIYRLDLKTDTLSSFYKSKIFLDSDSIIVKQEWCISKDSTRIPMFIVHNRDLKKEGNNPVVVYGYGGFANNKGPYFNPDIIPFLEKGGVYVLANIRGGGEFGEEWHKKGSREYKQNSFDDFIAAIEYLTSEKYTRPEKIAIYGWSNGGLLTSAVVTQRPELIKVAIVGAPVVDMFRYHLFHGGRLWAPEYGIAEHKKEFEWLKKYSPYHNIKANTNYPSVLTVTADQDDRVHPSHAYKLIAKLQESSNSDNPILLRVETKAGHGGAAGVEKYVTQQSDIWSFIFWQLGVK